MAKSKRAPALYEVIDSAKKEKKSGSLVVPKWWWRSNPEKAAEAAGTPAGAGTPSASTSPSGSAAPSAGASAGGVSAADPSAAEFQAVAPAVVDPAQGTDAQPEGGLTADTNGAAASAGRIAASSALPRRHVVAPPAVPADDADFTPPKIFRIHNGRAEISLNPTNAVVAGGVLVLLVFSSYMLGHYSGSGSPPPAETTLAAAGDPESGEPVARDPLAEAFNQRPTPAVLNPEPKNTVSAVTPASVTPPVAQTPTAPPQTPPPAPAVTGTIAPGWHVDLEGFHLSHMDAAKFAQEWFNAKGIPTQIDQRGNKLYLVSAEAFDYNQPAQRQKANQLKERVRQLGDALGRDMARNRLPVYKCTKPGEWRY